MKQFLLLITFGLLFSSKALSQSDDLTTFVNKYRNDKDFSFAFLSKDMFDVAFQTKIDDSDLKKLHQVIRNIGSLTILVNEQTTQSRALYREATDAIPAQEFEEILAVKDGSDRVRIWGKEENSVLTNLVLLVGTENEFVLISFAGALELNNLSALAGMFDATEAAQLVKNSETAAAVFILSPNPTKGDLVLELQETGDAIEQMLVLDQSGRQISVLQSSGAPVQQLSLHQLPAGNYWVQVKTQKGKIGVKQLQLVK